MQWININDLESLGLGCALLGSGGGGDPSYSLAMAKHHFQTYGPIQLIEVDALKEEDLILPIAFMGAPLVGMEKLPSGREFADLLSLAEKFYGRRPTVLMAAEIGGANGLVPLCIAGKLGLPVLNGDLMGRAFPQLQMTSCSVVDVPITPLFCADSQGNTAIVTAQSAETAEKIGRHLAVAFGSSCAVAFAPLNRQQAKKAVIPGTLLQAIAIGSSILQAKQQGKDPITTLLTQQKGAWLGEGTIVSIDQKVQQGFLEGSVHLASPDGQWELLYQNEYLLASKEGKVMATTPDILMLLEKESGTPLASESLRYGLKVVLIALPAPPIWKSPKGLELVSPLCFGCATPYQPIERFP